MTLFPTKPITVVLNYLGYSLVEGLLGHYLFSGWLATFTLSRNSEQQLGIKV